METDDILWCSGAYKHLPEYRFTGVTVAVCPKCGHPTPLTEAAVVRPHPTFDYIGDDN